MKGEASRMTMAYTIDRKTPIVAESAPLPERGRTYQSIECNEHMIRQIITCKENYCDEQDAPIHFDDLID